MIPAEDRGSISAEDDENQVAEDDKVGRPPPPPFFGKGGLLLRFFYCTYVVWFYDLMSTNIRGSRDVMKAKGV